MQGVERRECLLKKIIIGRERIASTDMGEPRKESKRRRKRRKRWFINKGRHGQDGHDSKHKTWFHHNDSQIMRKMEDARHGFGVN